MTLMKICVFAFSLLALLLIRKSLAVRSTKLGFEGFGCRWRKVVKTCHSNLPSNTFLCTHRTHTSTMKLKANSLELCSSKFGREKKIHDGSGKQNSRIKSEWVSEWRSASERKFMRLKMWQITPHCVPACFSIDKCLFMHSAPESEERQKRRAKVFRFSLLLLVLCLPVRSANENVWMTGEGAHLKLFYCRILCLLRPLWRCHLILEGKQKNESYNDSLWTRLFKLTFLQPSTFFFRFHCRVFSCWFKGAFSYCVTLWWLMTLWGNFYWDFWSWIVNSKWCFNFERLT